MSFAVFRQAALFRLILVVAVACLAVPLPLPRPARACSCAAPPSPSEALGQASAVFLGMVTEVEGDLDGSQMLGVRFQVEEAWKGTAGVELSLITPSNEASCGFAFEEGGSYLVYAEGEDGRSLVVYLCSRTVPASEASADLEELGPGVRTGPAVNEPRPFPTTMALLAGALVIAVLAIGGGVILTRMDNNPDGPDEPEA